MGRGRYHRMPVAEQLVRMPRWLRPKLQASTLRDVALVHMVNLDAIARGDAKPSMLWDVMGSALTWLYVARALGMGEAEMQQQMDVATRLVERFGRTGRVGWDGPDYQLAKQGLDVMDQLAARVDHATACLAADWSEAQCNAMADAVLAVKLAAGDTAPAQQQQVQA